MSPTRIPANVIFGATGAGKTTAVLRLLAQRPRSERWAVLVNEGGAQSLRKRRTVSCGRMARTRSEAYAAIGSYVNGGQHGQLER